MKMIDKHVKDVVGLLRKSPNGSMPPKNGNVKSPKQQGNVPKMPKKPTGRGR